MPWHKQRPTSSSVFPPRHMQPGMMSSMQPRQGADQPCPATEEASHGVPSTRNSGTEAVQQGGDEGAARVRRGREGRLFGAIHCRLRGMWLIR